LVESRLKGTDENSSSDRGFADGRIDIGHDVIDGCVLSLQG